jgi:hypothetical protein
LSGSSCPFSCVELFLVPSKLDIHHEFVSRIAPGLAPPVSEGVNSTS